MLRTLKHSVNRELLLSVYFAYVFSIIKFGIIFWGNSVHWNKIFKLQKLCIRIIAGAAPRAHCRQLFKKFNLLTVTDIYILECTTFVKANFDLFKINNLHGHNTRFCNKLLINKNSLEVAHRGARNAMIRMYNKLPVEITNTDNIKSLESSLKTFLRKEHTIIWRSFLYNSY